MNRRIIGFHQDVERHWVADLECGHAQHVRHQPPLQSRPWVLEDATRQQHIGTSLSCVLCDAVASDTDVSRGALSPYEDARIQGLCEDGAREVGYPKARPTVFQQLRIDLPEDAPPPPGAV